MNLIGLGIPTIFTLLIIVITDCSFTLKAFLTIIYILKFLVKYDTSKGGHSIHGGKIYKFIEKHTSCATVYMVLFE